VVRGRRGGEVARAIKETFQRAIALEDAIIQDIEGDIGEGETQQIDEGQRQGDENPKRK
jgi:hypothetical protein